MSKNFTLCFGTAIITADSRPSFLNSCNCCIFSGIQCFATALTFHFFLPGVPFPGHIIFLHALVALPCVNAPCIDIRAKCLIVSTAPSISYGRSTSIHKQYCATKPCPAAINALNRAHNVSGFLTLLFLAPTCKITAFNCHCLRKYIRHVLCSIFVKTDVFWPLVLAAQGGTSRGNGARPCKQEDAE